MTPIERLPYESNQAFDARIRSIEDIPEDISFDAEMEARQAAKEDLAEEADD